MDAGGEGERPPVTVETVLLSVQNRDLMSSSVSKVKHLEVSCSSMAEDICRKSAIIETYVMDSRRGETQTHTEPAGFCPSQLLLGSPQFQKSVLQQLL